MGVGRQGELIAEKCSKSQLKETWLQNQAGMDTKPVSILIGSVALGEVPSPHL